MDMTMKVQKATQLIMNGLGGPDNSLGWDQIAPSKLTKRRKRWLLEGGRMGRLSKLGGGYLRARLEEESFFMRITCPMRAGYQRLLGHRIRQVMGADSRGALRARDRGEEVCGAHCHCRKAVRRFSELAGRGELIFSHWHCKDPYCTKLHETRVAAEHCDKCHSTLTPKEALRRYRMEHDRAYAHLHGNKDANDRLLTPDQVRLLDKMEELSEEWYSAGWCCGLEEKLWKELQRAKHPIVLFKVDELPPEKRAEMEAEVEKWAKEPHKAPIIPMSSEEALMVEGYDTAMVAHLRELQELHEKAGGWFIEGPRFVTTKEWQRIRDAEAGLEGLSEAHKDAAQYLMGLLGNKFEVTCCASWAPGVERGNITVTIGGEQVFLPFKVFACEAILSELELCRTRGPSLALAAQTVENLLHEIAKKMGESVKEDKPMLYLRDKWFTISVTYNRCIMAYQWHADVVAASAVFERKE